MSASNPFSFNNWLNNDGDNGGETGDDAKTANNNFIDSPTSDPHSVTLVGATIFEVKTPQNAALAGQNKCIDDGAIGVHGQSDGTTRGIGVAGACDKGWGVAGVATTPAIDPGGFPDAVGVFGAGDVVGIYGQSRPKENQLPSVLPPPAAGTAIYGIGDVAGVEGDCAGAGTGVVGESTGGKGVVGSSVSAADIGVYGQSLASLPSPLPLIPGTGVFGTGDRIGVAGLSGSGRGGVFSTGSPTHPPVAQAQLVPVELPPADVAISAPPSRDFTPRLPRLGQAGDVLAVTVPAQVAEVIARLWFCVQSGTTPTHPAIWAEISYSRTIAGTGP